jgi:hypothetical protein
VAQALFVIHLDDQLGVDVVGNQPECLPCLRVLGGYHVALDAVARLQDEGLLDAGLVDQQRRRRPLGPVDGLFQLLDAGVSV